MNKEKSEFFKALSFLKKRYFLFFFGVTGQTVMYSSAFIVEAFMYKLIIDASVNQDIGILYNGIWLIIISCIVLITLTPFFMYSYNYASKNGMTVALKTVFNHRGKLPLTYFDKFHSGDLVSRILNDTDKMTKLFVEKLRRVAAPFIYGLVCAVPMFILNWQISIVLVFINILSLLAFLLFSKPIRNLSDTIQLKTAVLTENLINILSGIYVIKMFPIGRIMQLHFDKSNKENTSLQKRRNTLTALLDSVNFLFGIINTIGLLIVGAFLVSTGFTTIGTLVALMNMQKNLNYAFLMIGINLPLFHESLAGASRIFEFLNEAPEPEKYSTIKSLNTSNYIELKNIEFNYADNKPVFKNLSMSIQKGMKIALFGPSGSGKSTIIKLLLGFYPPKGGSIAIEGKSICEYSLHELRKKTAYVSQDCYIYNGTIEENIKMGNLKATDDQILNASRAAYAHDFVMEFPEGYTSDVGERGSKLSGGQKQRIAIARAILKNAPILLLDEATSALDMNTEKMVNKALSNLMKNKTAIIIAHRLSTVSYADYIYVINDGIVVEQGSHDQLISKDGLYKILFENQFNFD